MTGLFFWLSVEFVPRWDESPKILFSYYKQTKKKNFKSFVIYSAAGVHELVMDVGRF